jgi:uncharacterized protein (DUF1778 family)
MRHGPNGPSFSVRFANAKDLDRIRRAAKIDHRSMNASIVLAAVRAAEEFIRQSEQSKAAD